MKKEIKKKRKVYGLILTIAIVVFCSLKPAFAEDGDAGAAGAYLRMGIGARALAMGGSFVAIADDAYATYWNPAGLVQLEKFQIGSMYSVMSCDRRYNFLNYAQSLGETLALGISWFGFEIDDIEKRDSYGNLLGKVKDSENSLYFSVAREIIPWISLGGNIKILNHQLAGKSATGFGCDIGSLFKPKENLSLGVVLQDIGSFLMWNTESKHKDNFPLNIRLGGALRLIDEKLLLACDLEKNLTQAMKLHLGVEYWVTKAFALRTGYDDKEITAGAGFKISSFCIDLSFSIDKVGEGNSYRISILFSP